MPEKITKSSKYSKKDVDEGKGLAWMSYVGPLVFVPFFAYKKNKYIQDHAKQGMNLFILEAIVSIGGGLLSVCTLWIAFLGGLIAFAVWIAEVFFVVISVMGIVNSVKGEYKNLPLIDKIKFIK